MPIKETKLAIPAFRNEKEEALWWEKHRGAVEKNLRAALRQRKAEPLTAILAKSARTRLQPVTLRLATEDIATARQLADNQGIGYQTYIKLLLHDALRKQASRQVRRG